MKDFIALCAWANFTVSIWAMLLYPPMKEYPIGSICAILLFFILATMASNNQKSSKDSEKKNENSEKNNEENTYKRLIK